MKIFLNKFVLIIFFVIFSLIWYQIYKIDNSFSYKDTNSYFYILKWNWYIISDWNKKILNTKSAKIDLKAWDILSTIGTSSLWIIEWWDSSVTRIWWNSKLEIKESDINKDLSSMKIKFKLIEWKSWSNVVSMFSSDSYFKEEFQDEIARVRWTVFEVNLDNKYLYVKNHEVNLENIKDNTSSIIKQWEFFSLDFFEKIDSRLKDALWQELNENIDKNFLINLRTNTASYLNAYKKFKISNYFDDKLKILEELNQTNPDKTKIENIISKMSDDDKSKLYYMLMFDYQRLNAIWVNDNLFSKKMLYRDVLMSLASDEDKKTILKYALYDFWDSLSSSGANISSIWEFLSWNKEYIQKFWIDTSNFSNLSGENLKSILWKNFDDLKSILKLDDLKTINQENIKNTINNFNDEAHTKVNDTLNSIFNFNKKQ